MRTRTHMRTRWAAVTLLGSSAGALAMAAWACTSTSEDPQGDAGVADVSAPETSAPDTSVPDASPIDAAADADAGADAIAAPTVFATGSVGWIALDSQNVYWTNGDPSADGGVVMRAAKADGGAPEALAAGQQSPGPITSDTTAVYWINRYLASSSAQGAVMKAPIGGGTVSTVLTQADFHPRFLAVFEGTVFVGDTKLEVIPVDGGAPLATSIDLTNAQSFTKDDNDFFWSVTPPSGPASIAKLPFADAPDAAATVTTIATLAATDLPNASSVDGIVSDGTNVYWAAATYADASHAAVTAFTVLRAPINNGASNATPSVVASIPKSDLIDGIASLDTDGANVYFTAGPSLMKVSTAGGTPVVLTTTAPTSNTAFGDVKIDATHAYVGTDKGLLRVVK